MVSSVVKTYMLKKNGAARQETTLARLPPVPAHGRRGDPVGREGGRENGYNKLDDIVDQEYERAGLSDRLTGGMAKQICNPW